MSGNNDTSYKSLGEMFYKGLHRDGVLQYLDDTGEVTTYSDMLKWTIRTAINLKKMGISRQDVVSSCSHNQKYSPVHFIAAQYLGALTNSFDPKLSHLDTIHLLKLMQPKVMFVSVESLNFIEHCLEKAGVSTEIVVFGPSDKYKQFSDFLEVTEEEEKTFQIEQIENDADTAVVFFSSGTTGLPKGICISHRTFLKSTGTEGLVTTDGSKNVSMLFTSFYWISASFYLIRCVRYGNSSVVRAKFDPEYTWRLIEKYKVNTMYLAPYDATEFCSHKPEKVDVSSLKILLTGSCLVSSTLINKLRELLPNTKITNGYGQTEAAGAITFFDLSSPKSYELQLKKPLSCGQMAKYFQWKVVDVNTEKLLGPNERGELRIKNDEYLLNGYYKMDSSSVFDSEGYLKTGDLVYYDEDECFYVVGRLKEMFKYRGWHILPNMIENILLSHPAVKEAAVIGIPHKIDGDHPLGVVVLFNGFGKNCAKEIEEFVNEKVADSQKLRAGVKIIDSMPKTTTGKIRRGELIKMILETIEK